MSRATVSTLNIFVRPVAMYVLSSALLAESGPFLWPQCRAKLATHRALPDCLLRWYAQRLRLARPKTPCHAYPTTLCRHLVRRRESALVPSVGASPNRGLETAMFKQSKPTVARKSFRKRATAEDQETPVEAEEASKPMNNPKMSGRTGSLLSFEEDMGDTIAMFKKKKKSVAQPARESEAALAGLCADRRYDAATIAQLASMQQSLPTELACGSEDGVEESEMGAAARRERARRRDEESDVSLALHQDAQMSSEDDGSDDAMVPGMAHAPDFVPIGANAAATEAHRQRRPRTGAHLSGTDDAPANDVLIKGAVQDGQLVDDDEEELAKWEQELVARGSTAATAATAVPTKPSEPHATFKASESEDAVDRAVDCAAAETEQALRTLAARRAQFAEHDASLARAACDAAKAREALHSLEAATGVLRGAIGAYLDVDQSTSAIRVAMSRAIVLAQAAEDAGALNLSVYHIHEPIDASGSGTQRLHFTSSTGVVDLAHDQKVAAAYSTAVS